MKNSYLILTFILSSFLVFGQKPKMGPSNQCGVDQEQALVPLASARANRMVHCSCA